MMFKLKKPYYVVIATVIIAISFLVLPSIMSQDAGAEGEDEPIQFSGRVESIEDGIITVSGLQVDISNTTVSIDDIDLGITVTVSGVLQDDVVIADIIIIIINPPDPTPVPEGTAEVTPEPEMTPEATPEPEMTPEATPVVDDTPIIVIEGPVQEININTIVIFDIEIQVDPADEVLTQIQIGDVIRVEGDTTIINNTIIIVAINITIIEVNIFIIDTPGIILPPDVLPPNCRRTPKGKITCRNSSRRS